MIQDLYWITSLWEDRTHLESLGVAIVEEGEQDVERGVITYKAFISDRVMKKLAPFWHRYYWGRDVG